MKTQYKKSRKKSRSKQIFIFCLIVIFTITMMSASVLAANPEQLVLDSADEEETQPPAGESNGEILVEVQQDDEIIEVEAVEEGASQEPVAGKAANTFDMQDGPLTLTWSATEWTYSHNSATGSVSGGGSQADPIEIKQTAPATVTPNSITIDADSDAGATELFIKLNAVNIKTNGSTESPLRIIGGGTVHLMLEGSSTLDASSNNAKAGLQVESGNKVTISGDGALNAIGSKYGAGIGGNGIGAAGSITIDSGSITAYGSPANDGYGAGIGGGGSDVGAGGAGGEITINGGTVTAYSCKIARGYGAGIGGGGSETIGGGNGGTIKINSGSVTAASSEGTFGFGAGIGGGGGQTAAGAGGNITIEDGTVKAASSVGDFGFGAGIGGGHCADSAGTGGAGGTIIINGGTVEAASSVDGEDGRGAGIGGGSAKDGTSKGGNAGNITINGGDIRAYGAKKASPPYSPGIGGGSARTGGSAGNTKITGGNIFSASILNNLAVGTGIAGGGNVTHEGNVPGYEDTGTITIDGGNVQSAGYFFGPYIVIRPKNSKGDRVYRTVLTVNSPAVASGTPITSGSLDGVAFSDTPSASTGVYGIKNVKTTTGGKLNLWFSSKAVPVAVEAVANGNKYQHTATIKTDDSTEMTLLPESPPVNPPVNPPVTIYTFTFKYMDTRTADRSESVAAGNTMPKPADPLREGYSFAGWYEDAGYATKYEFSNPVNQNTTVYAKWTLLPFIESVSPEGEGQPLDGSIEIIFNKDMTKAGKVLLNGAELKGEFSDKRTYSLPYELTEYNKDYTVDVSGFIDVDGLIVDKGKFYFKTEPIPKVKNFKAAHPRYEITDRYTLKWDAIPHVEGYVLYGSGGTEIARTTTNSKPLTGLNTGTKYAYRVIAVAKEEKSEKSDLLLTTPRPLRPEGMRYISKTNNTVTVEWKPVKGANYYRLFLDNERVETVPADQTTYTFTGLEPGTKYNFKVAAVYRVQKVSIRGASAPTKALTLD